MKPLAALSDIARQDIRCVLTDIDDTLSTQGRITAETYTAMEALHAAGYLVIPVTGRPAGWCDHIARMWPVDAIVGENGAFYFHFSGGRLHHRFLEDSAERAQKRARLDGIARRILAEVPGCALAADQPYRETDLAIDYSEDVPPLALDAAERIAGLMRDAGLNAKISSIHVNGWFGGYDKLSTSRVLFSERFGLDPGEANKEFVFAGDSANDAPMFGFFENSVGVANVRRFEGRLAAAPKYVTRRASGAGFVELAEHLLHS